MRATVNVRCMQLWPSGASVEIKCDPWGPDWRIREPGGRWRKPGKDDRRRVRVEVLAETYRDREIVCCDSSLVDALLKRGDIEGFCIDDIENLYANPSDWTAAQCRDWLDDHEGEDAYPRDPDDADEWREAVRDRASDHPQEPYEWWRVADWLCKELRDIGEPVIDNDYGCWWGRTCTGQGMLQDGTLQKIAAKYAE